MKLLAFIICLLTTMAFGQPFTFHDQSFLSSLLSSSNPFIYPTIFTNALDSFAKPNNSSSIGTAAIGGSWQTMVTTNVWGLSGSNAIQEHIAPANQDSLALLTPVPYDYTISVTISNLGTSDPAGIFFRGLGSNYFRLVDYNTTTYFQSVANWNATTILSSNGASGGDVLSVLCWGPVFNLYRNGSLIGLYTNATYQYQTNCGILGETAGSAFHNFYVTQPAPTSLQRGFLSNSLIGFVCFNMPTFQPGVNYGSPQWALPNTNRSIFSPNGLSTSQWLDGIKASGAKAACLCVKHHDGFCLWSNSFAVSGNAQYAIQNTSWYTNNGRMDIFSNFCATTRAHGLNVGIYFSIWDRTYELQSGNYATNGAAAILGYTNMIAQEISQLLTNYGSIQFIQTDGWGWNTAVGQHNYILWPWWTNLVKSIQPNCLCIENGHDYTLYDSDVVEHEDSGSGSGVGISANNWYTSDDWQTFQFNGEWFWWSTLQLDFSQWLYPRLVANFTQFDATNYSTYDLAVVPGTNGLVSWEQMNILSNIPSEIGFNALTNLALGKSVNATAPYGGLGSSNVVTSGNLIETNANQVWISAGGGAKNWVTIDLGANSTIHRVEVFNTQNTAYGPGRLRDLTVTITNNVGTGVYVGGWLNQSNVLYSMSDYTDGPGQLTDTIGGTNVIGRYVTVARTPTDSSDNGSCLELIQVMIF